MKKKFNLSKKISRSKYAPKEVIATLYVKEFIKLLKDVFRNGLSEEECAIIIFPMIDKLAGDELLK